MKFSKAVIEAIAYAVPDEILSSDEIEKRLSEVYTRLKLPAGRLELMTGIKERRLWPEGTTPSKASTLAGEKALASSKVPAAEIDLLVHSAVCRDRLEPATASYVHNALKLPSHAQIMDVSNACLGFLNALTLAASLIESGQIRNALVVAGENGRSLIDGTIKKLHDPELTRKSIKPYFANLTVGCASVAAVLTGNASYTDENSMRISSASVRVDSAASALCEGGGGSSDLEMLTESEQLLHAGINLARSTWDAFREESGWDESSPERVICHQVGKQHQIQLYESLNLDLAKDYSTYPELGNVGSVSLPITLAKALESGFAKPKDKFALLGIGSGLSCMMMALNA